jgi:hypothetical protein
MSAPDGELQLKEEIARDRAEQHRESKRMDVSKGRAKFVKVWVYPQVYSGDIHNGYWMYLQVGREDVSIKSLIDQLED